MPHTPTAEETRAALLWAMRQADLQIEKAERRSSRLGPKAADVVVKQYLTHHRALAKLLKTFSQGGA